MNKRIFILIVVIFVFVLKVGAQQFSAPTKTKADSTTTYTYKIDTDIYKVYKPSKGAYYIWKKSKKTKSATEKTTSVRPTLPLSWIVEIPWGWRSFFTSFSVCFDKKYWGNFVRYSSKFFFKMCFDVFGFYKIRAQFYPQNKFVKNLLKDCGFDYEVTLPSETLRNGVPQDIEVWSLYRKYYYK